MDRQAKEYQRFIRAFMAHNASLPSGNLLTMMDLLARAQFMEGLAKIPFHTLSAKGATSKAGLIKVIGLLMQKIDPTVDPSKSIWAADGSTGLYKSAWLGANRIFAKTQGGNSPGVPLEATDLLNDNMLLKIEAVDYDKLSPKHREWFSKEVGLSQGEARAKLISDELSALGDVVNQMAIEEEGSGNFFWEAGKRFRPKALAVVRGEVPVDDVGGAVAMYAKNAAINVMAKRQTEMSKQMKALRAEMMPGEEEVGDFDLSSMGMSGWDAVVQAVLNDPHHPFSQDFLGWLVNDVMETALTDNEKAVFRPYLDMVIDMNVPTDSAYAKSIGKSQPYFAQVKKKFLDAAFAAFKKNPPDFLNEASNALYLMDVAKGRIRAASDKQAAYGDPYWMVAKFPGVDSKGRPVRKGDKVFYYPRTKVMLTGPEAEQASRDFDAAKADEDGFRAASDKNLRAGLIRLAHAKPEFRPHILPLLKSAAENEMEAGRTWGNPDPRKTPDDSTPYNKHEDSPPAGADGSAQRKRYNKWFQQNVCPDHATNCGDPARFGK